MSWVWVSGSLFYWFRYERKNSNPNQLPLLNSFPRVALIAPFHNEEDSAEETILNLLNHSYPNFEVIAVATDDTRTQKRVKPLVSGKEWEYTILLDTNQDFKRAMTIVNIPYTIVVKNHEIVHIQNGYVPGNEKDLYEKLQALK
jgi:cellulose synthase/poly-beta-1,6-N-acetylglucosamine synthase-like glycosyltransferase